MRLAREPRRAAGRYIVLMASRTTIFADVLRRVPIATFVSPARPMLVRMVRPLLLVPFLVLLGSGWTAQPATMDARCREILENWRPRFEAEKLTVLVAPPFVIAGDGGA